MKNIITKIITVTILLVSIFTTSCRKDQQEFVQYASTLEDLDKLILQHVPQKKNVTQFNLLASSTDTVLVTDSGIRLIFNDLQNIFVDSLNGNLIQVGDCQNFQITLTEAIDRTDELALGIYAIANQKLLHPAGFVNIDITCDGEPIKILPSRNYKINLPVFNNGQQLLGMTLFSAATFNKQVVDWVDTQKEVFLSNWQTPSGITFGYELVSQQTGWVGAAKIIADTKTNFCISLPSELNGQNTKAYLWFPGLNALVPMEGSSEAGRFCFADAPVGYPVKIAVVAKVDQSFKFASLNTEIGNDGMVVLNPEIFTEAEIIEKMRSF